jgi:quercetin dioxygenase-like cupin family protein
MALAANLSTRAANHQGTTTSNTDPFESELRRDGYLDIRRRSLESGVDTTPHTHAFDTRLMVLQGEMSVVFDDSTMVARAGDVIEIPRDASHFERYRPGAIVFVAGLRHPATEGE